MTGKPTDGPDPVDVYVGAQLRKRRLALGMSQESLAAAGAISFQQVQKYESGSNRISCSRLVQFAKALDVPVAFFFPGDQIALPEEDPRTERAQAIYESYRRRVPRLPAWSDLQPNDPFDDALMGAALELADDALARAARLAAA
ncbi:MAG TPA: helix-turn-helix transcriptional regulator [Caulobacteraceae bacterium]|nr:helix-turn-helix transcriptional regulator [Caulobacteraceae bacterium]